MGVRSGRRRDGLDVTFLAVLDLFVHALTVHARVGRTRFAVIAIARAGLRRGCRPTATPARLGDADILVGNTILFWGKAESYNPVDVVNSKVQPRADAKRKTRRANAAPFLASRTGAA